MRLTDAKVAALSVPAGKKEIIVFDDSFPGFGIRIREGGSRRFIFQYKLGATHRRFTFKETDAKRARRAAEVLSAKVTLGSDPALEKESAHDAAGDTFRRCLDRYLARPQGKRRDSTMKEIRRHLGRNLAPLHRLHIKNLDRRRVSEELSRLTTESGPVQANRTRASLSKFLNWCIAEGYADINVAAQTNKNEETKRDRVLGDTELRTVLNALPPGDFGDVVKLLILTAARREEISQLRWAEINLTKTPIGEGDDEIPAQAIKLPGYRTKNGRVHVVPLSQPALAILKARQQNGREYVFGVGEHGFSGFSKSKERLDTWAPLAKPWIIHDLRRSAATGIAKLGIQPHIVECVLNHAGGFRAGTASRYNKHPYETEKKAALDLWGAHITELVS
jgi:integrase